MCWCLQCWVCSSGPRELQWRADLVALVQCSPHHLAPQSAGASNHKHGVLGHSRPVGLHQNRRHPLSPASRLACRPKQCRLHMPAKQCLIATTVLGQEGDRACAGCESCSAATESAPFEQLCLRRAHSGAWRHPHGRGSLCCEAHRASNTPVHQHVARQAARALRSLPEAASPEQCAY